MSDNLHWYCVYTQHQAEETAHAALGEAGYAALWLHYLANRNHSGKRVAVKRSLFPGYIFVGAALGRSLHPAKTAIGVAGLVPGTGGMPYELPLDVLDDLRSRCDADGRVDTPKHRTDAGRERFEPGTPVTVIEGPFKGLPGTVIRDDGGSEVHIQAEVFAGRPLPMSLHPAALMAQHHHISG